MPFQLWENKVYVIIRFFLWVSVWGASLFDFVRYKGEKVHGWQLHRCIFVVLTLLMIKELLVVLWIFISDDVSPLFYALLFFWNVADGSFQWLLMLISYGWKITREHMDEGAISIWVAPTIYTVAMLCHNYIWAKSGGLHGLPFMQTTSAEDYVLLVASLAYMFTVIYMWLWVFQTIKIEKMRLVNQILEKRAKDQAEAAADDAETTPYRARSVDGPVISPGDTNVMGGTDIPHSNPFSAERPGAPNEPLDPVEARIFESDENDTTTMPLQAKLKLLFRYFIAVSLYFMVTMLVMFLSLWSPDSHTRAAFLVVQNALFLIFMSGLAYIFRLRQANPYFMLDEYEDGGVETHELDTVVN
eukprot:comp21981_c0_seq1/m.31763 comp21981_c0_seq1/g.31763  ORF comp21981_c0_seq1/g.31763 comp21981_c0_seq1/m.31763 type:complete len:358 (-) comp21981_c0_seq1:546-1619(-)